MGASRTGSRNPKRDWNSLMRLRAGFTNSILVASGRFFRLRRILRAQVLQQTL
jgi:hypothetical protein